MRIFKDLEMVEYLGSGMPRILKAYSQKAYTFSSHFIRVTFPISQEALELEKEVENGLGKTSGKTSGKIIGLISADSKITIPEIAKQIGITERSVERNIRQLQKNALLKRIGPAKGGHWEVMEKEND